MTEVPRAAVAFGWSGSYGRWALTSWPCRSGASRWSRSPHRCRLADFTVGRIRRYSRGCRQRARSIRWVPDLGMLTQSTLGWLRLRTRAGSFPGDSPNRWRAHVPRATDPPTEEPRMGAASLRTSVPGAAHPTTGHAWELSGPKRLTIPRRRANDGRPQEGVPMRFRRHASLAVAFGLFLSLSAGIRPGVSAAPATTRPNMLLIVSDDQTGWTFSPELNPSVYADLVDKGVLFNRAYDVSPECCPSRSEIMTGLYETHTGVDGNKIPLTRPTLPQKLHDIGYHTILAGKYLNSWPCTPRPEFDQWICSDEHSSLVDPTLNVNGTITHFTGYTTQIHW